MSNHQNLNFSLDYNFKERGNLIKVSQEQSSIMSIKIIFTNDVAENIMQKDAELLKGLSATDSPILHLYTWKNPSITYGHFVEIETMLNLAYLKEIGVDVAKRPTGGGVIFHLFDYAFSFLLPSGSSFFSINPLENYALVNGVVFTALKPFLMEKKISFLETNPLDPTVAKNFCMAKPTIYDLVVEEKKIVGAAQRKKNQGVLHQGSISIQALDQPFLQKALVNPEIVLPKMIENSFSFLDYSKDKKKPELFIKRIQDSLIESFQKKFS